MTGKQQNTHIVTGSLGEDEALRYLSGKGFKLSARNWRPEGALKNLELDLVGEWESSLVFVEVKAGSARRGNWAAGLFDSPAGLRNFTPAKRKNMVRAAGAYLGKHGAWNIPCRFDLVCVTFLPGQPPRMDHYRNVIELGQTLDSGNASWQPW